MAKVISGFLAVLCGAIIVMTGDASLLTGQPEVLRVAVAAVGDQPMLYTAMLALPLALLLWAVASGGRLSKGALAAWAIYIYFAFMAFSGAVKFASEPLYLNPYALPLVGFILVLFAEKPNGPVAAVAPMAGGSALPPDPASVGGRGARRG